MAIHAPITGAPDRATSLPIIRLLQKHSATEIGSAIEVLLDLLDVLGGDTDAEDGGELTECCSSDLHGDTAWTEWYTRGRHKLQHDGEIGWEHVTASHEDAEDDDPREDDGEDCCPAAEDDASRFSAGHLMGYGWDRSAADDDAEDGDPHERPRQPVTLNREVSNDA